MCNRIFYIAFFAVHGLSASFSAVFSASLEDDGRQGVYEVGQDVMGSTYFSPSFPQIVISKISKLEWKNEELRKLNQKLNRQIELLEKKQSDMEVLRLAMPFKKDEIVSGVNGINDSIDSIKIEELALDLDNLLRFECTRRVYEAYYHEAMESENIPLRVIHRKNLSILDSNIQIMKAKMRNREMRQRHAFSSKKGDCVKRQYAS